MSKLNELKKSAYESCKFRKHDMIKFNSAGISQCRVCGRYAIINANPLPNETNICGSAVAVNCD